MKYKLSVLVLRMVLISVPYFFAFIGEKAEKIADWLGEHLPDPRKNR